MNFSSFPQGGKCYLLGMTLSQRPLIRWCLDVQWQQVSLPGYICFIVQSSLGA
jgi:hypothetical protein